MAEIETGTAFMITFWVGLLITILSIYFGIQYFPEIFPDVFWFLGLGVGCLLVSYFYYKKRGWSELIGNSLGCLVAVFIISLIISLWDLFFG